MKEINSLKVASLQLNVSDNKEKNTDRALAAIERAARVGADLVCLPEMWNCPYVTELFPEYAEEEGGRTWQACSDAAREHGIYLSAGSIPEKDNDGHIYNTAYMFDRSGSQIGKHRKVHMFDINICNGQTFRESDTLTAGAGFEVFETEFGKAGIAICYDFRFPESARLLALAGATVMIVPASFNMTTGPAHWELMFRQRAVENQAFVIATSPARDVNGPYVSYGHSMIADPWGRVLMQADEKETEALTEIDLDEAGKIREQMPLLRQRRTDIYELTDKRNLK